MRMGLAMLFWGLLVHLATVGLQLLVTWLGVRAGQGRGEMSVLALLALGALGLIRILAVLAALVGMILCCTIPAESRARGWALGSLVGLGLLLGEFVSMICAIVLVSVPPGSSPPTNQITLVVLTASAVMTLTTFAVSLCFTLVLRAAARFWKDPAVGRELVSCLVVSWGLTLASTVLALMEGGDITSLARANPALMLTRTSTWVGVLGQALLFWVLVLLRRLRSDIPGPARAAPRAS
jgi:hypothetical protein